MEVRHVCLYNHRLHFPPKRLTQRAPTAPLIHFNVPLGSSAFFVVFLFLFCLFSLHLFGFTTEPHAQRMFQQNAANDQHRNGVGRRPHRSEQGWRTSLLFMLCHPPPTPPCQHKTHQEEPITPITRSIAVSTGAPHQSNSLSGESEASGGSVGRRTFLLFGRRERSERRAVARKN